MVCLEMCGEHEKKLNQFFPTSSQIDVSFEKYRIAVVSRRFRPICSVYDFEIFYSDKVVQQVTTIKLRQIYLINLLAVHLKKSEI